LLALGTQLVEWDLSCEAARSPWLLLQLKDTVPSIVVDVDARLLPEMIIFNLMLL
jgi:hypothetical protein